MAFSADAESVHLFTVRWTRFLGAGSVRCFVSDELKSSTVRDISSPVVFGMKFQSRVGLAAGFDKNAELLPLLPELGFGFAEIGTVTPRPQQGNPRPRLFRDLSRKAIFNRMGFNNLGAMAVAQNLYEAKKNLPTSFRVGANFGKNKDTPLEKAHEDYISLASRFKDLADYVVVNVSSPNTPGLRSLQTQESLRPIVEGVVNQLENWSHRPPLLVKLAPEIPEGELKDLVSTLEGWGVDGWILTNTLQGVWKDSHDEFQGGWSGAPLSSDSQKALETVVSVTERPVISVGGIMDEKEAQRRLDKGAQLLQIYTGWVYEGPEFPFRLRQAITK